MTDEHVSGSDDGSDSASASDDEDDDGARSDVDEETKQQRQKLKLYNEEIRDLEKAVESKKREVESSTNIIVKVGYFSAVKGSNMFRNVSKTHFANSKPISTLSCKRVKRAIARPTARSKNSSTQSRRLQTKRGLPRQQ